MRLDYYLRAVRRIFLVGAATLPWTATLWGQTPRVAPSGISLSTRQEVDRVVILRDAEIAAEFVFRDPQILRPYFTNVCAPSGRQVTRNHPPIEGRDATDHATMHPGIWLAFGDINGRDFWRNKATIEHVRFTESPHMRDGVLSFVTESELRSDDSKILGELVSRIYVVGEEQATLFVWEALFKAGTVPLQFGDQEEMGFGVRVATPVTEKQSGRILNSAGQATAEQTWGQPAAWCDYANDHGGITVMASPANFRPSWWHNRNYGLCVANPFGRAAMKQGERSVVTVEPGGSLRLRFAAAAHDAVGYTPQAAYERYVALQR